MRIADFEFDLPPELIAQHPLPRRDASRMLVVHRDSSRVEHKQVRDLREYLRPGDVLVFNDSRVIAARLRGSNLHTGGAFELLLLQENGFNDWWVMMRPGKRARVGTQIGIRGRDGQPSTLCATVIETNEEGHRRVRFSGAENVRAMLEHVGEIPLPPYIERTGAENWEEDRERYQNVFARTEGSIAAPTAGLHLSESLLNERRQQGIETSFVTLHVGLGTFAPVKSATIEGHRMHEERFEISTNTAQLLNQAKAEGRRIVAVGTTTVRVLETVAEQNDGAVARVNAGSGSTRNFLHPPYQPKIVDALLTNFHLPRSTLLMLVSAFAAPGQCGGRDLILAAYGEAIRQRYRFFSYGDAMLIL